VGIDAAALEGYDVAVEDGSLLEAVREAARWQRDLAGHGLDCRPLADPVPSNQDRRMPGGKKGGEGVKKRLGGQDWVKLFFPS
jgi:hypothetical protein